MNQFDSASPIGVVDCAAARFFREDHSDIASTTGSTVGSEQSLDVASVTSETPRCVKEDVALLPPMARQCSPSPTVHTATQASCDLKPSFTQRSDGSFLMELSHIDVKMSTTCFATEPLPDETDFRPLVDACVVFPEVQLLVFDPATRKPAGMCMAASTHKCLKVLDVPLGYDLNARICAYSTSGTQTLKERLYTNGCQNRHADVDLNYELRANGYVSTSNHQLVLEVDFSFRCWLSDSAMGFLHEGEWWGLVVSRPSEMVLSNTQSNDYELSYIEHRLEEISDTLSSSGSMSASCLSSLKSELAQLEKNGEMLEMSLFYDASPDQPHGATEVGESPKKSMLRRFLKLYENFKKAQYKAVEITPVR